MKRRQRRLNTKPERKQIKEEHDHGQTMAGKQTSNTQAPGPLETNQSTKSAQFVCPSLKVLDFKEKRLHWESVVHGVCICLVRSIQLVKKRGNAEN